MKRSRTPFYLLILFSLLALSAHLIPYFGFDLTISSWVQASKPSWFAEYMKLISALGNLSFMPILVSFSFSILFFIGLKTEALINLVSIISSLFVNGILKTLINRPRPASSLVDVYSYQLDKSFPSGHTMTYTIIFGFLLYLVVTNNQRNKLHKTLLIVILSIPILTIGVSRIYLGVHWASDVIGGYLLGTFWLYCVISYYRYLKTVQS